MNLTIVIMTCNVIIACISAFIAYQIWKHNKWSKINEVTVSFINRFDNLYKDKGNSIDYWRRFWNLQQEQFLFWQEGLLNESIYDIWMMYRAKDFEDNKDNFREFYEDIKADLLPCFREYIFLVFTKNIRWKKFRHKKIDNIWLTNSQDLSVDPTGT